MDRGKEDMPLAKKNLDKQDEEIDNKNNDWIVNGNGDSEHQLALEEEKGFREVGQHHLRRRSRKTNKYLATTNAHMHVLNW